MPLTITPAAKVRAMVRAQARINPTLESDLRDDIANFLTMRRRCELQLTGELQIPDSTATPEKLRAHIADLDRDIATHRQQLAALQS